MMNQIPTDLEQYEFIRSMKSDETYPGILWHLIPTVDEGYKPFLTPDNQPDKKDWNWDEFFGDRTGPIEIEIGSGKGGFIIDYSRLKPDLRLLGMEIDLSLGMYCSERFLKHKCDNVRMLRTDAYFFFRDYIKDNTVSGFHMYFPDPWPKKRHHKNRLMKADFIHEVRRVAQAGSLFNWGTDHQEYNADVMELFHSLEWMECVEADAPPTCGISTNFENIFRAQGLPIYRSIWRIHKD
jgi:tRNA (guanine-N7-)-methyltransferase